MLEIRCIKYIYNRVNCKNNIVRLLTDAVLINRRSVLDVHFRHLSFKYKIDKYMWHRQLNCLIRLYAYINAHIMMLSLNSAIIREL